MALMSGNSAGARLLTEFYVLLSIATGLVGVRCYGRIRLQKGLGWDDISIVAALILLIVAAVLITIEVANGLGKHAIDLKYPERTKLVMLKYNTFYDMESVLCTLLTKISVSIYILRIKNDRPLRILLWILMVLMSLVTITDIIVVSVSCIPLRALWTPSLKSHARCLPLMSVYNVAYVQSGFTIVTDLCLTISPIVILWNVRIKKWKKVQICTLMSLGLVATVSNGVRNYFQSGITSKDPTYAGVGLVVVSVLELSSGIIAACIPACMPFINFRKQTERTRYSLPKMRHTHPPRDYAGAKANILRHEQRHEVL